MDALTREHAIKLCPSCDAIVKCRCTSEAHKRLFGNKPLPRISELCPSCRGREEVSAAPKTRGRTKLYAAVDDAWVPLTPVAVEGNHRRDIVEFYLQRAAQKEYQTVKPLEHFNGEWSLDVDQRARTVRVQKTRLESKALKKGGTDLFRGNLEGLHEYLKKTYPGFQVHFVSQADVIFAKYTERL